MNDSFWREFGFSENPYFSLPIQPTKDAEELFVGREELGVEFRTLVEGSGGCVVVISGDVGVGKTSFFNYQQYLLYARKGYFGPHLLPAYERTSVTVEDRALSLVHRMAQNAVSSLMIHCKYHVAVAPDQLRKLSAWLSVRERNVGYDFGFNILSFGGNVARTFYAPSPVEATLENWKEIFEVIASEVRFGLGFQGVFVVLDNAENFEDEALVDVLMSYRDTLFSVEGIWWVIIGQSGLSSTIQALDKRVAERIQGKGLEVPPLKAEELHEVIEARVKKFRSREDAVSPISLEIHKKLYEVSRGEIRFVLKTSDDLMRDIVSNLRNEALRDTRRAGIAQFSATFLEALSRLLTSGHLPDPYVLGFLKNLTFEKMNQSKLKRRELLVLKQIGGGEAQPSQFRDFKIATAQDFSSNYLSKMFRSNLLHRRQAGRQAFYGLRGYAALAREFQLFEDLAQSAVH